MTSVETSEEELTNLPTRRELKSHTTIPSRRTDERGSILAALKESGEPMAPNEIAAATGMPSGKVRQLLFKMVNNDNKITSEDEGGPEDP
jgi:hypothetical protein